MLWGGSYMTGRLRQQRRRRERGGKKVPSRTITLTTSRATLGVPSAEFTHLLWSAWIKGPLPAKVALTRLPVSRRLHQATGIRAWTDDARWCG
jgi:hypothetical protein